MKRLLGDIIDLFFPPRCVTCETLSPSGLCSACMDKINYLGANICSICGDPADEFFVGGLCNDCRREAPPFDVARSVALYDGVMKEALHSFKFSGMTGIAKMFGDQMTRFIRRGGFKDNYFDLVVPVPLSRQHESARGYNQSLLLAEEVARYLKLKIDCSSLRKIKNVKPQSELKRDQRFANIKGAYESSAMDGSSILLIDDIFTTGATASESSAALKNAGAKKVSVLTLARAVED